ncbi:hypothetical protein FRC02_011440 [Tulasnella sp. 418]|nr:hypothetical protein FRC02_011440 [Tulasnella sp. 418]
MERLFLWIAVAIPLVISIWRSGRRAGNLPPGPPTIPFFGNSLRLSSFTRVIDYRWFQELGKKFGPIISLKIGSATTIILVDDGTAIRELFGRRAKYNSRPANTVNRIVGRGLHPVYERNPHNWRFDRKMLLQFYNSSIACRRSQLKVQEAESTQLLKDLIESTTDTTSYDKNFRRFAFSAMTSTAYGFRTPSCEHPVVYRLSNLLRNWGKLLMETPPFDIWPWLKYFIPQFIVPWKERCKKTSDQVLELYRELVGVSRQLDDQGVINETLAHKLFTIQPDQPKLSDDKLGFILGVALEGGSDILANSLNTTLMALLTHPDVQAKGRMELDLLCDQDTIPTWAHVEKMQYIRSIGKESFRWRPPFPMGVPHALIEDDEYMGYKLPAGSTVSANIWAIHMNPDRYEDPQEFKPERFQHHSRLTGDYIACPDPRTRDHFTFSPGRRTCPGVYMAEQAQMLVIAKLLWAFDITTPPGVSISDIDTDFHTGFLGASLRFPKSFPVVLKPRSERRVQTIMAEFAHLRINKSRGSFERMLHSQFHPCLASLLLPKPAWCIN